MLKALKLELHGLSNLDLVKNETVVKQQESINEGRIKKTLMFHMEPRS